MLKMLFKSIIKNILRGKNPDTDEITPQMRDRQFTVLREAQEIVLNLTNWHSFFKCLVTEGYRGSEMINSDITLIYAYAIFLIGKTRFGLSYYDLERLIGRGFIATRICSRYIGSFESEVDADLRKLKDLAAKDDYIRTLENIISTTLTSDFWTINLPERLDSSSAVNPQYFAYLAAQDKLNAPILFSDKKIHELLDPVLHPNKKPLEKHHPFPRAWLERQGIKEINRINQIANFALLDWLDNIDINDSPPSEYVPILKQSPNTGATNEVGFTAIPAGHRSVDGSFSGLGESGTWHGFQEYFTIWHNLTNLSCNHDDGDIGASVRCVKD